MGLLIHSDFRTQLEYYKVHIAAVYYNGGKENLFRIHVDVTLGDLKHHLTQLNGRAHHRDQRTVTEVEYRRPSVFSDGTVLFTNMKLQTDGDVRTMFSIA
jgi:hypothetical protein